MLKVVRTVQSQMQQMLLGIAVATLKAEYEILRFHIVGIFVYLFDEPALSFPTKYIRIQMRSRQCAGVFSHLVLKHGENFTCTLTSQL
jgi:hypothetical protein